MAKRKSVGGAEFDAFSKWRGMLSWKPGEVKKLKRKANKRERQEAKREARNDD